MSGKQRIFADQGTKPCCACNINKPLSEFTADARTPLGYQPRCKLCRRLSQRVDYHKTIGDPKGRARRLFHAAKLRANKKRITFGLDQKVIETILRNGVCQRTGLPFDLQKSDVCSRNPFAPSMDRITVQRGYEPGNTTVVCSMYNNGKGEHSEIDFIAMCVAVAEIHGNNPYVVARLAELRAPK